jgi:hypothetical protein
MAAPNKLEQRMHLLLEMHKLMLDEPSLKARDAAKKVEESDAGRAVGTTEGRVIGSVARALQRLHSKYKDEITKRYSNRLSHEQAMERLRKPVDPAEAWRALVQPLPEDHPLMKMQKAAQDFEKTAFGREIRKMNEMRENPTLAPWLGGSVLGPKTKR